MKTLFVLSDTHRNAESIQKLLPIMRESDYVLHLGDYVSDMKPLQRELDGKLLTVLGNGDFFSKGDEERVLEIEGLRVLMCHGHSYGVKRGRDRLLGRAKELSCALALYGHTHNALIEEEDGIRLVNPGCMTRLEAFKSYAYIIIDNCKAVVKITEIF